MIAYHGTPIGGSRDEVAKFLKGRHAMISFAHQEDLPIAAEVCQSFAIDNGAYTAWKQGKPITDWRPYYNWVKQWARHPAFAFAIIPDVIGGDGEANDDLVLDWQTQCWDVWQCGVPVWHFHEHIGRFKNLARRYTRVALGSSGQWPTPGTKSWWSRVAEFMPEFCDEGGRPLRQLHGLRMLDPEITSAMPFTSADSTNVARNANDLTRFGSYRPPTRSQRCEVIASRIEDSRTPAVWVNGAEEQPLLKLA